MQIALGRTTLFTILILPIQEHGKSFHLLVSSSVSFFSVSKLLLQQSSLPGLSLLEGIFQAVLNRVLSFSQHACHLGPRKVLLSVEVCILPLCCKCLSALRVFFTRVFIVSYVQIESSSEKKDILIVFLLVSILFLLLFYSCSWWKCFEFFLVYYYVGCGFVI